jgi:hypothetical protein
VTSAHAPIENKHLLAATCPDRGYKCAPSASPCNNHRHVSICTAQQLPSSCQPLATVRLCLTSATTRLLLLLLRLPGTGCSVTAQHHGAAAVCCVAHSKAGTADAVAAGCHFHCCCCSVCSFPAKVHHNLDLQQRAAAAGAEISCRVACRYTISPNTCEKQAVAVCWFDQLMDPTGCQQAHSICRR